MTTENTEGKAVNEKPWQFQPGQSGNPAGKPRGIRHKATQAVQTMLEGETQALTRKAIDLALSGDTTALKLCLERLAPALKPTALPVEVGHTIQDSLAGTAKAMIVAAANGEMPPDIAAQLVSALASVARVEELETIKQRLEGLEAALKRSKK